MDTCIYTNVTVAWETYCQCSAYFPPPSCLVALGSSAAPFFWVHLCKWICNLMFSYQDVCWRKDIFVLENWQLGQGHPKKGNSALEGLQQKSRAHQVQCLASCSSWKRQNASPKEASYPFTQGKETCPWFLAVTSALPPHSAIDSHFSFYTTFFGLEPMRLTMIKP